MRREVDLTELHLPVGGVVRSGQEVLWYQNGRSYYGQLAGHRFDGKPTVVHVDGHMDSLDQFDQVRAKDPKSTGDPNWRKLPRSSKVVRPTTTETELLQEILNKAIPTGTTCLRIVEEIWSRGFEVFLVGGTVRDVLIGKTSHDVDLVTSMPLVRLIPILQTLCRFQFNPKKDEGALLNGHLRVGGSNPADPFADICVFKKVLPGDNKAVFGGDLIDDLQHRDFACNSVYYDPMNNVLIDPSGTGISDAAALQLEPVFNQTIRNDYQLAQVIIRFFKFTARGFKPTQSCLEFICANIDLLRAMSCDQRCFYMRTQWLSKLPLNQRDQAFIAFRSQFEVFGLLPAWTAYVEPHITLIRGS